MMILQTARAASPAATRNKQGVTQKPASPGSNEVVPARRLAVLVSVLVVLTGLVAYTRVIPSISAQDATSAGATGAQAATANHPVVGLWRTVVSNTGAEPFASLSTFHADGTYTEVLPDGPVLSGVWRPTGERTAIVTCYLSFFLGDRRVLGEGRFAVEVDESGNAMTETGPFVALYEDGSVAMAVESPATGTRLEVLPVEPLGTPVLPPDPAAVGTPAP